MAKKATKYLVETSAVPPGLSESTRSHCEHFAEETSDGSLWTSSFIRKEYICRWILYYIEMAARIDHFESLSDALYHLEQDWGRGPKTAVHAISRFLQEKGGITDCRSAAEEFGRLAVTALYGFDRDFKMSASNRSGCTAGSAELRVDFNNLFDDLRRFVSDVENATDCRLRELLKLGKSGGASTLLNDDDSAKTEVVTNLKKLAESGADAELTCKQCRRIGDAVIALEQPKSWCLVHIDHSFNALCKATGRDHKQILSQRAVENSKGEELGNSDAATA